MISHFLSNLAFRAPADEEDTTGRREILERLRALDADNDNDPPVRQARTDSPRHSTWQEKFASLKEWKRMRETSEAGVVTSNWMLAQGDVDAPANAEASKPNDWAEEDLILAASLGVRWKQVGGRLVPADGSLEYAPTGRLIRCGALVLADDLVAANDNDPDEDEDDTVPDLVDVIGRTLNPSESIDRGRRHGARVRVGSVVGILHRTKRNKVVVRTEPRNAAGRFRPRKGKMPPPQHAESPDDIIDAKGVMERVIPSMTPQAVMVMDFALRAANLHEIGELLGKQGKHAERVGKQTLLGACAEFESALRATAEKLAA